MGYGKVRRCAENQDVFEAFCGCEVVAGREVRSTSRHPEETSLASNMLG